jgi:hypothetical protein
LRDDHRRADDLVLGPIDEHEDVLAQARILDLARETLVRKTHDFMNFVAVVRQVDGVQVPRDVEQLLLVTKDGGTYLERDHRAQSLRGVARSGHDSGIRLGQQRNLRPPFDTF